MINNCGDLHYIPMNRKNKIIYRQAAAEDNPIALEIFTRSMLNFEYQRGYSTDQSPPGQRQVSQTMVFFQSIFDHITRTADQFWIAELDSRPVGYARSILRDGVRDLTDFFVLPGEQSNGVGSGLMERAFPDKSSRGRLIIATTDERAQATYLKSGVYPVCPVYYFGR